MQDNGCLSGVPGEYVAQASEGLPDPATATVQRMAAVIDAGWFGPVRIEFERMYLGKRGSRRWVWMADRADKV